VKLLTAIIRPERLSEVLAALERENLSGLTVTQAAGCGNAPPLMGQYRGAPVKLEFHRRSRIEVALADAQVERAVSAVRKAAVTGRVGDGKIWIQPITDLVRIRDGARGGNALMPACSPGTYPIERSPKR
jgi:nitrogen regulatory protein P-II 1